MDHVNIVFLLDCECAPQTPHSPLPKEDVADLNHLPLWLSPYSKFIVNL